MLCPLDRLNDNAEYKCVFLGRLSVSVECPTLAHFMISQFMGLSPTSGSVLTAQSLEPASDSVPPLSVPPPFTLCLSKMNKR